MTDGGIYCVKVLTIASASKHAPNGEISAIFELPFIAVPQHVCFSATQNSLDISLDWGRRVKAEQILAQIR